MALGWSLYILNPADPEREPALIRARELSEQLGEDAECRRFRRSSIKWMGCAVPRPYARACQPIFPGCERTD
jgi:hypothetical protein